jgi:hypothetical protein
LEAILEIFKNSAEKMEEEGWGTWAGGGATAGRPPRPRHSLAEGPQPGCVIPGTNV